MNAKLEFFVLYDVDCGRLNAFARRSMSHAVCHPAAGQLQRESFPPPINSFAFSHASWGCLQELQHIGEAASDDTQHFLSSSAIGSARPVNSLRLGHVKSHTDSSLLHTRRYLGEGRAASNSVTFTSSLKHPLHATTSPPTLYNTPTTFLYAFLRCMKRP